VLRDASPCQVLSSSRRLSALRRTVCAVRWSDQKSGLAASSSSSLRRVSFAGRSKPPRGRVDPRSEVSDGGVFHALLAPCLKVLEQGRPQFENSQRGLAPSDDGVDTWTVSVVRAHAAVPVAAEPCRIATGAAVSFARDQVGVPLVADLGVDGCGQLLHVSLFPSDARGGHAPTGMTTPEEGPPAGLTEYRQAPPTTQGGNWTVPSPGRLRRRLRALCT
jgi:hypothetical protein